jgi:hypothetical protein
MVGKNKIRVAPFVIVAGMCFSGAALSQQQEVSLQEQDAADGNRQAALLYYVSNNEPTTGIGFRVHFASSKVNVLEIESHLELSNVGIQIMSDTHDLDNDASTDFYINAAWVDLNGEWPATETLPVRLYSFTFDSVSADIFELFNISQSSSPVGFEFVATMATNQK